MPRLARRKSQGISFPSSFTIPRHLHHPLLRNPQNPQNFHKMSSSGDDSSDTSSLSEYELSSSPPDYVALQDTTPPPIDSDNGSDVEASTSNSPIVPTPASGSQTPQFPIKRRRGRPSKASLLQEARMLAGSPINDPNGDEEDYSEPGTPTTSTPNGGKKRRGRPPASARGLRNRGGPSHVTAIPRDEAGNEQEVVNDEIVLPIDDAGEQKVDKYGRLLGGREYRCRTFTVKGRGDRLYMLSTEPARCMGFRDSYLLFQRHKKLFKIIADDDEKFDMISRELIPHSYKGRAIGIVTARSIFREFGAKIIVGGRKVVDDYYEQEARDRGDVEGEIADPTDKLPLPGQEYNRNQYVAWHGASSVYHTGQPTVPTVATPVRRKKVPITSENWMLEHAQAAS